MSSRAGSNRIADLESADRLDDKDEFLFFQNSSKKTKKITRGKMLTSPGVVDSLGITPTDTISPNTPTGVVVTSSSEISSDGKERIVLKAVANPNNEADLDAYGWRVRRASGDLISITNGVPSYTAGQAFDPIFTLTQSAGSIVVISGQNKITNSWEVVANTYYEVSVCAIDKSGNASAYSTLDSNSVVKSARDTTAPNAPTNVSISSALKAIFLDWTNPTDKDLATINIYRNTTNNFSTSTLITSVLSESYTDTSTSQGTTYYYWLKSKDFSGNESASPSTVVSATPGLVANTDITTFAVDATKMFTNTVILKADVWTDNSPSAGYIAWNAHTLVYGGASYSIAAGSTNQQFVYWTGGTSYATNDTNPTLTDGQFMIATNAKDANGNPTGLHDLAWNAIANAVIGSAYIQNAAITNAKISDLNADKIRSGSITSQTIVLDGGGVLKSSGVTNFNSGTGFWLEGGATPKFAIGDLAYSNNGYLKFDNNILTVRGEIQATSGTFGASLGTANVSGVKIDSKGLLLLAPSGSGNNGRIAADIDWGTNAFTPTSTSGFYLGGNNNIFRFFIGNTGSDGLGAGQNFLYWNGSVLKIGGNIVSGTTIGSSSAGSIGNGDSLSRGIDNGVFTISGGSSNGIQYGSQIDLVGSSFGAGKGSLFFQAGYSAAQSPDNSTDGRIVFRTSKGVGGTAHQGVDRMNIELDGTVVVYKGASIDGAPNGGAGDIWIQNQLFVGPDGANVDKVKLTSNGEIFARNKIAVLDGATEKVTISNNGNISADNFTSTSSKRFKKNIKNFKNGLEIVDSLRPVSFAWKTKKLDNDFGFIAEEVEKILPNIVGKDKDGLVNGIDYSKLTVILVKAVKELSAEVEKLKKKVK